MYNDILFGHNVNDYLAAELGAKFMTNIDEDQTWFVDQAALTTGYPCYCAFPAYDGLDRPISGCWAVFTDVSGVDHTVFWDEYDRLKKLYEKPEPAAGCFPSLHQIDYLLWKVGKPNFIPTCGCVANA